nr:MAG TPA: hypothetical protein [Caudoviricetes sp.]
MAQPLFIFHHAQLISAQGTLSPCAIDKSGQSLATA